MGRAAVTRKGGPQAEAERSECLDGGASENLWRSVVRAQPSPADLDAKKGRRRLAPSARGTAAGPGAATGTVLPCWPQDPLGLQCRFS